MDVFITIESIPVKFSLESILMKFGFSVEFEQLNKIRRRKGDKIIEGFI